jgi:hypothetical protein
MRRSYGLTDNVIDEEKIPLKDRIKTSENFFDNIGSADERK